jgi:hypothetical protein
MDTDKTVDKNVPDLLVRYHAEVAEAARDAVRDALLRHKREGNPVAVERDGEVVLLNPDEIEVNE